jgi:hypothetical protein
MRTAPSNIAKLAPDEIFVFGSNLAGVHGAGAAKKALEWGALWGQGIGHYGNTYALPTKDAYIKTLPINEISRYVDQFVEYAFFHKDLTFLVTEIGCEIGMICSIGSMKS